MFHIDMTFVDTRIIAEGSDKQDQIWDCRFIDSHSGMQHKCTMMGFHLSLILHVAMCDDGNGTHHDYERADQLLKEYKVPNECRPIA